VVAEVALAHGRLYSPHPEADGRWGPPLIPARKALRIDGERWTVAKEPAGRTSVRGQWGIALLSRLPVREVEVLPLGQLPRDPARRALIRGVVDLAGGPLTVHGTHMSHITHGSHVQYRLLGTELPPLSSAAVLAGDMNLWGPPVSSYVRGWRRASSAGPGRHPAPTASSTTCWSPRRWQSPAPGWPASPAPTTGRSWPHSPRPEPRPRSGRRVARRRGR